MTTSWHVLQAGIFSPTGNFYLYIAGLTVDSLFEFAILVELGWSVLRPLRAALPRWSLLAVAALIALSGAVAWPFATSIGFISFSSAGRLMFHVQGTFAIMRILFFFYLPDAASCYRSAWRDRELQIATGLGLYSLVSLAVWMRHTSQAWGAQYHLLDELAALSYVISLVYWVFCFAHKEAKRREFTPEMQNFLLAVAGSAKATRVALASDAAKPPKRDRR